MQQSLLLQQNKTRICYFTCYFNKSKIWWWVYLFLKQNSYI